MSGKEFGGFKIKAIHTLKKQTKTNSKCPNSPSGEFPGHGPVPLLLLSDVVCRIVESWYLLLKKCLLDGTFS